ncbi:unnamed protein product [Porites evermanni]|uniref:Uncharacterized protein n=1 Tax=Porites evermanni TaxID=104178 RepID=A0ABN8RBK3_9CNID|nr:unnamed protein product [Porites evermanni]
MPTEKMKEYRRQVLERDFETARKEFMKQINEILSFLADDATELSHLQRERGKLRVRMDDFTSAYEELYNTFEVEEETLARNNHYDALRHKNHEALLLLNERISALQAQRDDRNSIYTSRSKQSRSSRLSRSSVESSSSLQRRAEMATKEARLQAELKFHDVESKETATLKRHEDEVKKLQMVKELAATKAELDAISKIAEDYEDVGHANEKLLPNDDCRGEQLENYLPSQLICVLQNAASSSTLPATNTTSASYVDVKANTNVTFSSGSVLPKSQVSTSGEVFSGDPLDYPTWKKSSDEDWLYPFTEFCKFVKRKARISCNPVTSLQAFKAGETNKNNCRNSTSLCIEVPGRKSHTKATLHSLIVPVWLHHEDDPNTTIMVYALLDDQTDA